MSKSIVRQLVDRIFGDESISQHIELGTVPPSGRSYTEHKLLSTMFCYLQALDMCHKSAGSKLGAPWMLVHPEWCHEDGFDGEAFCHPFESLPSYQLMPNIGFDANVRDLVESMLRASDLPVPVATFFGGTREAAIVMMHPAVPKERFIIGSGRIESREYWDSYVIGKITTNALISYAIEHEYDKLPLWAREERDRHQQIDRLFAGIRDDAKLDQMPYGMKVEPSQLRV